MERNRKNNTFVLVVLIVVITLCIIAYFYLKKSNDNGLTVNIQAVSNDTKQVYKLNDILKDAEFISDKKEYILTDQESTNISAKIVDNKIIVNTNDKQYEIKSIKNPVSVATFFVKGEDSLTVDLYVLDNTKSLYHVTFDTADFIENKIKTYKFALNNVSSYSVNVNDLDERDVSINFVVVKTSDGKYYTDYEFNDDREYTFRQIVNTEEEVIEEKESIYGILSISKVDPFSKLNFNERIVGSHSDSVSIDFNNSSLTYKGSYYDNDSIERKQTVIVKVNNIKQAGVNCDETSIGCEMIYYLTSDGNLYTVLSSSNGFEEESDKIKENTLLIDKNVTSFSLIPVITYDVATDGKKSLVYKKKDGKTYIYNKDSSKEVSQYKRYWLSNTFESPLYVVSKDVKVNKYLKTESGNNLVAKSIYTFNGEEEDGDGNSFYFLYILNEDNYLYYTEDYTNVNISKYSNKKVKNIAVRDDDLLVTFTDGSTDVIDAYLEYEAK